MAQKWYLIIPAPCISLQNVSAAYRPVVSSISTTWACTCSVVPYLLRRVRLVQLHRPLRELFWLELYQTVKKTAPVQKLFWTLLFRAVWCRRSCSFSRSASSSSPTFLLLPSTEEPTGGRRAWRGQTSAAEDGPGQPQRALAVELAPLPSSAPAPLGTMAPRWRRPPSCAQRRPPRRTASGGTTETTLASPPPGTAATRPCSPSGSGRRVEPAARGGAGGRRVELAGSEKWSLPGEMS